VWPRKTEEWSFQSKANGGNPQKHVLPDEVAPIFYTIDLLVCVWYSLATYFRCAVLIIAWGFSKNFNVTSVRKNFPVRKSWCIMNCSSIVKIRGMIVRYVTNSLTAWKPCATTWRKNIHTKTSYKSGFAIGIWISLLPFLPNLPYLLWETQLGHHLQNVHDLFLPSFFHPNSY